MVVYNREFREKNLKENIAGVFTLGQATIEDIQALEEIKEQRTKKSEDYATRCNTLEKKRQEESERKTEFRDDAWKQILKPNETDFKDAFSELRNSKELFLVKVLEQYEISHASSESRESLLSRSKTLFAKRPEMCEIIPFSFGDIANQLAEIETSAIWGKVIAGNKDIPIGRLSKFSIMPTG